MLYTVFGRTRFSLWEVIAVIPVGLNPFMLECISFRYDAPYMACSVLCAVTPLLFRKQSKSNYLLAIALGTVGVCTSYQAATGIFPMLVVFLALRMWNAGESGKNVGAFIMKSAVGYLLGLIFFVVALMRPASAGYVSSEIPAVSGFLPNTIHNLGLYYGIVLSDLKAFWLVLAGVLAVGFVVSSGRCAKRPGITCAIAAAAALVLMGIMCFGLYPVLKNTLFAYRAMYGFGVYLAIMGISAAEGKKKTIGKVTAAALSWCFLVFSFTYGNTLNIQREYTDFRIQMVIQDLNQLECLQGQEAIPLRLCGGIGKSPLVDRMSEGCPILKKMVPETFVASNDLTRYPFFYKYGLSDYVWDDSNNSGPIEYPVLSDGIYHTILGDETYLVIILK